MPRPREGTKFGSAHRVRVFTCADGHVHLIGYSIENEPEYEIVLGGGQFGNVVDAITEVRSHAKVPQFSSEEFRQLHDELHEDAAVNGEFLGIDARDEDGKEKKVAVMILTALTLAADRT